MKVLKDDVFSRQPRGVRRRRRSSLGYAVFALASLALLALSRIDHPFVRQARIAVAEVAAPVLRVIAVPLAPVRWFGAHIAAYATVAEELERVKAENQTLKGWEARARELERRLASLSALAHVVEEPGLQFVTGRVVADAKGPFARSVLLDAGNAQGIKSGFPVVSADGLVGRTLETTPRSTRVLLLTDLNSRIPVLVGTDGIRAILTGDNSSQPRLAHLPENATLRASDEVVTSGVGGLFPRGLRIGSLVETEAGSRVALHARLDALEHVSVLFFETPGLELADELPKRAAEETQARRSLVRRSAGSAPGEMQK